MAQSIAYFAGFETGDASECLLGGISGTASIQTTTVRTGGYALKLAAGSGGAGLVNPNDQQIVGRTYFRFGAGTPAGNGAFLLYQRADALFPHVHINASKQLEVNDLVGTQTAGATVLVANTWYRVEFIYDSSVTNGALQVYLNGTIEINTTDTSGNAASNVTSVTANAETTVDQFMDDVRIDKGGLAVVGAGQCIARQGIAGTPTYNAWTKNGAATAALCWSDTPFSAATNCSDNVLNDAQTMQVGSFTTDPGRAVEGTQIIGVNDAVNAVKVGMIAKTAVAGNINIRRRVGSTDTDTAVALTTSDAYYQTAFFTDTVANLNAYEIGVKNALIATTETVEDMWMMVDYTPGASEPDVALPQEQGSLAAALIRRAPLIRAY